MGNLSKMEIIEFYKQLHNQTAAVFDQTSTDAPCLAALTIAHNYIPDYEKLEIAIKGRPESDVVRAAIKEYQFALYAVSIGQYRHAFGGLRLFFELMLVSIQFSAHEIDFRMWNNGEKDINWSALKSGDTGIFSVNFVKAFNTNFKDLGKQYLGIAESVYRECSEYVHGNSDTHDTLSAEISFQNDVLLAWTQKSEAMRIVIVFCFAARYLSYLKPSEKTLIEPIVIDVLGHLPAVQAAFASNGA